MGATILLAAVAGGSAIGLAFFAPVSFQFSIKHENPLLAASKVTTVAERQIEVSPDAPPVTRRTRAQPPQPMADELIALNPMLPIADRGREYVIFDMRRLYGDRTGTP